MRKIILILLNTVILAACRSNSQSDQAPKKATKADSIIFTTNFSPSFDEYSQIKLIKVDSVSEMEILIMNNYRVDKNQDTFYCKSIAISPVQYHELDTSIFKNVKTNYKPVHHVGVDGINISFLLVDKGDTSYYTRFWSPDEKEEIFGYRLTGAAITKFRQVFNDSIVTNYLDDVEGYLDDKKNEQRLKKRRPIDDLRAKKYGWKRNR
jgi:hypothetical protein